MTRNIKHKTKTQPANLHHPVRWIVCAIILVMVVAVGFHFSKKNAATAGPDLTKLSGQWLRPDGGYILELSNPTPGGLLKATYFNPRPINVSRAEWKFQEGRLSVYVELRDANYPGSTYTLDYDPAGDRLKGIYFQAALQQQFEVEFERTQ